jgi:hypothetical protein
MKDKNAVVCILARDCAKQLKNNIPRIEDLQSKFNICNIYIVENDSVDNTKNIINEWRQRNKFVHFVNCDGVFEKKDDKVDHVKYFPGASLARIKRMTRCRNIYLDAVKNDGVKPDYMIIIDVDILSFESESIVNAIKNAPDDWSAIFANGIIRDRLFFLNFNRYYDVYALNTSGIEINRNFYDVFVENSNFEKKIKKTAYYPVSSAFGGIGIYKYDSIKNLKYYPILNSKSKYIECNSEHISINYELFKKGYGLYIARDMFVIYSYEPLTIKTIVRHHFPGFLIKYLYRIFLKVRE